MSPDVHWLEHLTRLKRVLGFKSHPKVGKEKKGTALFKCLVF